MDGSTPANMDHVQDGIPLMHYFGLSGELVKIAKTRSTQRFLWWMYYQHSKIPHEMRLEKYSKMQI
jgi:hypothetical protein